MTEIAATDGREQGPKWALWDYETKTWDEVADPRFAVSGTYTTSEEFVVAIEETRGLLRRRRTIVVIAASAATLAAAAGVGGFAWWRGR